MKYEAVFGDQSLFDGANDCHVFACKKDGGAIYWHDHSILSAGSVTVRGCIAMRRIIKEPKRWTAEDQKAGRLPEVGCMVMVTSVDECASVAAINNGAVCVVFHDGEFTTLHKSGISPIETPEEKAQREEDEFVDSLRSVEIHGRTIGGYLNQGARAAYRKLKGGE